MNREPINPDDPQMSAYALGELSVAEAAEFEARLQDSPLARAELASMREIMSLLSSGLREEWKEGASHPALMLLEPFESDTSSNVIVGGFRPARRSFAAAAAVAAVLAIGAITISNRTDAGKSGAESLVSLNEEPAINQTELAAMALPAPAAHVPQLFLAEEVDDVSSLDLAIDSGDLGTRVDPSYLDASHVIPVGFAPVGGQTRVISPDRSQSIYDRVDSYLPPVTGILTGRGLPTGMIEKRLGRDQSRINHVEAGPGSVLVSGYITMGGGKFAPESIENGMQGFRPVSISANPVTADKINFQLISDLNGLEEELSEFIKEFPEESAKRAGLERILANSRKVVSQLEAELSR